MRLVEPVANLIQSQKNWLLLIGFLLLVFWMGSRELTGVFWVDEVRAAYRAGDPRYGGEGTLAEVWERSANVYDQTPGYYVVLAFWTRLVGFNEAAGEALSLLLGVLAIAVAYRIGREIYSPLAGLAAGVMLGSSALYLIYLHDMRTYTLIVLMTSLAIWAYWRLTTRRPTAAMQVLLVCALVTMIYSHYFAAIIAGGLGLYHVLFGNKRSRDWWRILFLFAVAGVSFLPWIVNVMRIIEGATNDFLRHLGAYDLPTALREILYYFSNGSILIAVLLVVLGVTASGRRGVRLVFFVLAAGLGLALAVNLWLQMLSEVRYLLVLWVPLAVICGVGFARLTEFSARPVWLLCGGLLVINGVWNNFDPASRLTIDSPNKYLPWDTIAEELKGRDEPGDRLIFSFAFEGWDGDHWETSAHYLAGSQIKTDLLRSLPIMTDAAYLEEARRLVQNTPRVWSAYDTTRYPWRMGMFEEQMIEMGYANCGVVVDQADLHIDLFARVGAAPLDFVFAAEDEIGVSLLETLPDTTEDELAFNLGWRVGEQLPANKYSLGVHVVNESGTLVKQFDYGLPQAPAGCVTHTLDLRDVPTGNYTINLIAYAWETGERVLTQGDNLDHFQLGSVQINTLSE